MTILKRTKAAAAAKTPIRHAVEAEWAEICEARAAGMSLNAIFCDLKAQGKNVGAGYSSFRYAVLKIEGRGANGAMAVSANADAKPNTSEDRFADDRFRSNWG